MNKKFGNGSSVQNVSTGTNGASRLRFVGVEDLGSGTKATFWLEMQPSFQNGTISGAGLFNRGAWAGLSDYKLKSVCAVWAPTTFLQFATSTNKVATQAPTVVVSCSAAKALLVPTVPLCSQPTPHVVAWHKL